MRIALVLALLIALTWPFDSAPLTRIETLRGKPQELRLYGDAHHQPVILSSGDGGWLHLAPHVAAVLASRGFYVIGFDSKAYLRSFTDRGRALQVNDVPEDFGTLISLASEGNRGKPILVGVSEGAGLSVLAGASPALKRRIRGVIGLGLGDRNELAWRWQDSVIYVTKGVPDEPWFSAAQFIPRVAPVPVALLRSSCDEYVTPEEAERVASLAREPKRVWTVRAGDHRFSDNLPGFDVRLIEALEWISAHPDPHVN
jgi:type IV secretory pathway VirJ component